MTCIQQQSPSHGWSSINLNIQPPFIHHRWHLPLYCCHRSHTDNGQHRPHRLVSAPTTSHEHLTACGCKFATSHAYSSINTCWLVLRGPVPLDTMQAKFFCCLYSSFSPTYYFLFLSGFLLSTAMTPAACPDPPPHPNGMWGAEMTPGRLANGDDAMWVAGTWWGW